MTWLITPIRSTDQVVPISGTGQRPTTRSDPMTTYSQTYGVKSNAKRAMRKLGVQLMHLENVAGGFRFPLPRGGVAATPPPKKAKAAKPKGKPFLIDTSPTEEFKASLAREAYIP